jgi:hypothetical protein
MKITFFWPCIFLKAFKYVVISLIFNSDLKIFHISMDSQTNASNGEGRRNKLFVVHDAPFEWRCGDDLPAVVACAVPVVPFLVTLLSYSCVYSNKSGTMSMTDKEIIVN